MSEQKTILIAEDEQAMLRALSDKFSRSGYNVLEAGNGEQAEVMAIEQKPDAIMLDIIMPKQDGIETMKNIRNKGGKWGQEVPIVMLTNLSDADNVAEAAKFGVYDFLVKTDWRLDEVVKIIDGKIDN